MDRFAIRRGVGVPTSADLNEFELGYRTGARSLYVGTAQGPVLLASANAASGVYPYVRLIGVYMPEQVQIATLFEGSDGRLYYKNKNGVTAALTAPPPDEE